jgi:hypothetical protein
MKCGPTWVSRRSARRADQAVRRTTPALRGLCSVVTLLAHQSLGSTSPAEALRQAAWYVNGAPTFSDALALGRRQLWTQMIFPTSRGAPDLVKVPRAVVDHLTDLLCSAA